MVFTKMQQITAILEICRMKTIAYYIDPLLDQASQGNETGFLEAFLEVFPRLPEFRHVLLTTHADMNWEDDLVDRPELIRIPMRKNLFMSVKSGARASLKAWLEKEKPDLLVCFNPLGPGIVQGKSLLISNSVTLLQTNDKPWKKTPHPLPDWVQTNRISVPFSTDRDQLLRFVPALNEKIQVLYPAIQPTAGSISWSEQETIKIRHSGGRDYFLYAGPIVADNDMVNLLKSYSLLKKWLMTGMPLILAGPSTDETSRLLDLLKTYKYRSDVTVLADIDTVELQPLIAGTYLMCFPYKTGGISWPLEWALNAGTPIITTDHTETREICADGASYAGAGDNDAWAHQMMVLYKDEHLRTRLIEKGQERQKQINLEQTLDQYATMIRQLSS